ncbi:MAG: class I SAM-dependent methyltransferase [Planctomycetota bacterium]|jgi:ubiquinone/menaquinone biosynthesis C-methylase UbiE
MKRILEPEYMDSVEEASSYSTMDNSAANRSFVEAVQAAGGTQGRLLDIGTGPGEIPILLAQENPELQITAFDAAEEMLKLAEQQISAAGFSERIEVRQGDAKNMPFEAKSFDVVVSNTILHHIPEPIDLLSEAGRVLGPGGVLVIRDLFRPESEEEAWRLVEEHAADGSDEHRRMLFDSLHAALTLDEARNLVRSAGLGSASVEMTSDRHYTIVLS